MYVGDPRAFKCLYSKIQAWLVSMRSTAIRTQAQQRIQPIQPVPLEILIANTASEKTLALFCQVLRRVTHDLTAAFANNFLPRSLQLHQCCNNGS